MRCPIIGSGLEGLTQRLNEVKARLQAKLAELSTKQDDAMAAQKEMAKRLEEVGFDVTSTASQVKQVRGMERRVFKGVGGACRWRAQVVVEPLAPHENQSLSH